MYGVCRDCSCEGAVTVLLHYIVKHKASLTRVLLSANLANLYALDTCWVTLPGGIPHNARLDILLMVVTHQTHQMHLLQK